MKNLLLLVLVILICGLNYAQSSSSNEWLNFDPTGRILVNSQSLQIKGEVIQFWGKISPEKSVLGVPVAYYLDYMILDCARNAFALTDSFSYFTDGSVSRNGANSTLNSPNFAPIPPGTVISNVSNRMCNILAQSNEKFVAKQHRMALVRDTLGTINNIHQSRMNSYQSVYCNQYGSSVVCNQY